MTLFPIPLQLSPPADLRRRIVILEIRHQCSFTRVTTFDTDLQCRHQTDNVIVVAGDQHQFDETYAAQVILEVRTRRVVNLQIDRQVARGLDDSSLERMKAAVLAIGLGDDRKHVFVCNPTVAA